jgi:hypothetical protein
MIQNHMKIARLLWEYASSYLLMKTFSLCIGGAAAPVSIPLSYARAHMIYRRSSVWRSNWCDNRRQVEKVASRESNHGCKEQKTPTNEPRLLLVV